MNVFVKVFIEKGMEMTDINSILSRMMTAFDVSTYKDLALKLGVSPNTIDVWKRRGNIPEKNILKCINLTGIDQSWLLNGGDLKERNQEKDTNTVKVSLYQGGAGTGVYNFDNGNFFLSLNRDAFPSLSNKPLTAIEVVGDSMEPVLKRGDYILVTPQDPQRTTEDGIYAIRVENTIKVKALHFKLDGTIEIISYNTNYPTEIYDPRTNQIDFEILGRHCLTISR